ncbi:hypothetical protein HN51_027485 [Arachis hypogaea]
MKIIIKWRVLASILIFIIIVHLLLFSSISYCSGHEQSQTSPTLSRKLLLSSSLDSVSNKVKGKLIISGGSKNKQTKKAVDQGLRKAPSSVPNPTQNK